jgi:predicted permease
MNLLADLLPIFGQTVLPVFLVAATGWVLARSFPLDERTIGRVLFYAASPALVFTSLYRITLDASALWEITLVALGVMGTTALLGWVAAWRFPREERAAITLVSGISNNANMGIPVNLFAFGQAAVPLATVYYVVSALLVNTAGSVVASSGRAPIRQAFGQLLRLPVLYASLLGFGMNRLQIPLYEGVDRAVELLGSAAIPMMLVMLGIQLRNTSLLKHQRGVFRASGIRLLVGPLLAVALTAALGITGLERNVLIMQAAMPTAVITSVLATEFDTAPHLVAAVIVTSTLLSMVTLSVILSILL